MWKTLLDGCRVRAQSATTGSIRKTGEVESPYELETSCKREYDASSLSVDVIFFMLQVSLSHSFAKKSETALESSQGQANRLSLLRKMSADKRFVSRYANKEYSVSA